MSTALVTQYLKHGVRLQIITLPYEDNYDVCALLRFVSDESKDPTVSWRFVSCVGVPISIVLDGENDSETFKADASIQDVFNSAWVSTGAELEVSYLFDLEPEECENLMENKISKSIFSRVHSELDTWV